MAETEAKNLARVEDQGAGDEYEGNLAERQTTMFSSRYAGNGSFKQGTRSISRTLQSVNSEGPSEIYRTNESSISNVPLGSVFMHDPTMADNSLCELGEQNSVSLHSMLRKEKSQSNPQQEHSEVQILRILDLGKESTPVLRWVHQKIPPGMQGTGKGLHLFHPSTDLTPSAALYLCPLFLSRNQTEVGRDCRQGESPHSIAFGYCGSLWDNDFGYGPHTSSQHDDCQGIHNLGRTSGGKARRILFEVRR